MYIPPEVALLAQDATSTVGLAGAGIGAGLVAIGAGLGIGKIGAAAAEGGARQPEAGNEIRGGAIVLAAFIEGVAFFGLVVCLIISLG